MMKNAAAVVLGMGATGLSVVRSLGRKGIPVFGVGLSDWEAGYHSRFCTKVASANPLVEPDRLMDILLRFARTSSHPVKCLYPSGDECVEFMAQHEKDLRPHYRFCEASPEITEKFLSKEAFHGLCQSCGVPTAATFFPVGCQEALDLAPRLSFPCIIKPKYYHLWKQDFGIKKALFCANADSYLENLRLVQNCMDNIMIQEVIGGPEANLRFLMAYIDRSGRVLAACTGRKIRQYPPDFGTACAAVSSPEPDIMEPSLRLVRASGYWGLVDIEYKYCQASSTYKMIEVNIRPCRLNGLADACGQELVHASFLDLIDEPVPAGPPQQDGIKWIFASRDIPAVARGVFRGGLSPFRALGTYAGRRSWCMWAWDDPGPALFYGHEILAKTIEHVRHGGNRRMSHTHET